MMATGTENSVWLDAAVLLPDEKIPVKFSRVCSIPRDQTAIQT